MILFFKELWALRFWLLFIPVVELLGISSKLWTNFIDLEILTIAKHQREAATDHLIFSVIIGLGAAATALGHEREHETQRFLDGLPVSRSRVYVMKCLAASLVSMAWPVTNSIFNLSLGALSQNSDCDPLPWVYMSQFTLLPAFKAPL